MPGTTIRETRNLVLPLDTVVEALVHFDRKTLGLLSFGEVLQGELRSGGKLPDGVDVAVRMAGSKIVEWHRYDLDAIATAIISYCRAKHIPLPLAGAKSLSITKDGISLHIENTVDLTKRAAPIADFSGRPLRYAKGYEPHAILPLSWREMCV